MSAIEAVAEFLSANAKRIVGYKHMYMPKDGEVMTYF